MDGWMGKWMAVYLFLTPSNILKLLCNYGITKKILIEDDKCMCVCMHECDYYYIVDIHI